MGAECPYAFINKNDYAELVYNLLCHYRQHR
jgi:hypothetical protein